MPITLLLGLIGVTASFNQRLLDPLTTLVATSFAVHTDLAVLLAPAVTLPFALGQPFLGPLGDAYGKALMLKVCTLLMALAAVGAAFAPNYESLFVMRMLTGLAAGGIVPASIAIIADRFPVAERQVAMSRFMTVMMIGQVMTAPASAVFSEAIGWKPVLLAAGLTAVLGFALAKFQLPARPGAVRKPLSLSGAIATYRAILADPRARICYLLAAVEGVCIFGYPPHMAVMLEEHSLGGVREAGMVLAAHGLGGLLFAAVIGILARRFTRHALMYDGAAAAALGLFILPLMPHWIGFAVATGMVGFGFFLLHSGLQTEITEVMPEARASAVSLHACFMFIGVATGPLIYGWLEKVSAMRGAFWISAVILLAVGVAGIRFLDMQGRAREPE